MAETIKRKGKPFPWVCPRCLKREVRPVTIQYTMHDVTIPKLVIPKCSACNELVFTIDTDKQISRAFRESSA